MKMWILEVKVSLNVTIFCFSLTFMRVNEESLDECEERMTESFIFGCTVPLMYHIDPMFPL